MSGLEVVASAAGLVLLSLQTCNGLVAYCKDWSAFDGIKDAVARLRRLEDTLAILLQAADILETKQLQGADNVKILIGQLEKGNKKFEDVSNDCSQTTTPDLAGKIKHSIDRAKFPFKQKHTIADLKRTAEELTNDLNLGIQSLQL